MIWFWESTSLYVFIQGVRTPTLQLSAMQEGDYTYQLTVTDTVGQQATAQVTVIVQPGKSDLAAGSSVGWSFDPWVRRGLGFWAVWGYKWELSIYHPPGNFDCLFPWCLLQRYRDRAFHSLICALDLGWLLCLQWELADGVCHPKFYHILFFFPLTHLAIWRISVPRPGIEPRPQQWNPNRPRPLGNSSYRVL